MEALEACLAGRTDGQTGRTKSPLFYRASPPSGPLPKKEVATGDEADKRKGKWIQVMRRTKGKGIGKGQREKEVDTGDEADKKRGKWQLAMSRTREKEVATGDEADKRKVATGDESDKRKRKWRLAMRRTKGKESGD